MRIDIIRPGNFLKDYVKCFWTLSHNGKPHTERLFPVGEPQMIFHSGEPFVESHTPGQSTRQPEALVCGQLTTFTSVTTVNKSELFGISLQPHALHTILKASASQFTDRSTDLTLIDKRYNELHERIVEAPDTTEKVIVAERYLREKIVNIKARNVRLIGECLHRISQSPLYTLSDMAARFEISHRQMERIFLDHVGVSARVFQKISRFNTALRLIPASASLTTIGYESGYFDQAHFSRSFKEHTGYSPGTYRQMLRDRG